MATEEPAAEATPVATEEPAAEATPVATEEPAAEATPAATEEPAAEATPVATEEAAPETLPNTGGGLPSAFSVITAVLSLLALGLGSLSLRRRQS